MARRKQTVDDEPEQTVEDSPEQTDPQDPTPEQQAAGDPGSCGETPCWSRTPITITHVATGRDVEFSSPWTGPISWSYGDGASETSRGEGNHDHTYTAAGTFNVVAVPVASSCAGPSAPLAVTVA